MTIASRLTARMISAATGVAALAMLSGCHNDPTVWEKDVLAPGGAWVATARTRQWGGFGSAWVETTVSLRKLNGTVNRGKPFDILSYPSGMISKAYVLSNENADTDLQLAWSGPTHFRFTIGLMSILIWRWLDLPILTSASGRVRLNPGPGV